MKQGNTLSTIVVALLAVGLAAYLGFYAWESLTTPFVTTYAYAYTVDDSAEAEGYLVRDELVFPAQTGILDVTLAEGEKVGKDQTVALVHRDNQALELQAQMAQLAMEIELLDYATSQTDDAVSAAQLDESILQSLAKLRFTAGTGNYSRVSDQVLELKSQVLKRGYTYGEGLDADQLAAKRQELVAQYRTLRSQSVQATSRLAAPQPGTFSSRTDGYESVLTPSTVRTMTPADLDALSNPPAGGVPGSPGKLIVSDRWYFAAALDDETAARLRVGEGITLRFSGALSRDVPMQVEQVGESQKGRSAVVLSSTRYLSETTLLRSQSAQLIFSSDTGLRVPKTALRMVTQEETDEKSGAVSQISTVGVYTVVGGRAEFKPVEIQAEGSDFYVVRPAATDKTALRAGDEVIVRATELYAGKLLEY